jgi:hypothetical protein
LGCLLALSIASLRAEESRIAGAIDRNRTVLLTGSIHPQALPSNERGAVDAMQPMRYLRISLQSSAAQAADLEQFLEAQRDPSSSDFHRWLTPEEYGERFGVSAHDLEQIAKWLQAEGFQVEESARARNWIAFSGTAGQVNRTFGAELRRYESGGAMHFSNAAAPSIPAALAGLVSEIHGLNDFHLQPPRAKKSIPDYTSGSGAHYLAPDDMSAIYDLAPLYQAGFDGSGQKLVIVGQTDINLADIRGFRSAFGLPAKDPQLVLYGPDPGVSSGDEIESDLDLEWSGAIARNATILFVYSQDVFESISYAIDQNLAPVISMSYGGCELGVSASNRAVAQQANAEGITWMNSSGDSGAAGCDWGGPAAAQYGPAVTFPGDIPEVTAVGGTEFNESGGAGWNTGNSATYGSAKGYLPEKGWNDTALGGGIWASGGGASVVFPKPWWQSGPGVPADGARDVPDVSLTASGDHDGYLIYLSGQLMSVGGTSASSPSFAGIVALINQYVTAKGLQAKPGLGNINPTLYNLAQNTTNAIHDVTSGDNIVPCVSKSAGCATGSFGFKATAGYDQVTGVGSVDAYNLVTKWDSLPTAIGTTTTLTANPASIAPGASTVLTAKVAAVTGGNAPTGNVNFTLGSVALGSAALTASGSTATAALTVKGASLASGANTITAVYTASGGFNNSTGTAVITLTPAAVATSTAVAAGAATVAAGGTAQLTATVKPASGSIAPTGPVTFLLGTNSLGTATLGAAASGSTAATATLSVSASKLATGANSITASYAATTGFGASVSAPVIVTVSAPLIATTAKLAANPASLAQSASTVLTITITPASGTTSPTGTVTFTLGTAALGTATVAGTGGTAAASLTVKGTSLTGGSNTIAASYAGDTKFSGSNASVTVTVTVAAAATTLALTANPASFAQNAATTLTATVKAATGTAPPAGTVTFTAGSTALGSAALAAPSGIAGGTASAVLSLAGSKLSLGNTTITASYAGAAGFGASTGTAAVTVTAPPVATSTTLAASPATIAAAATTQLTVTVRAASGSAAPSGSVGFAIGNTSLGSAVLGGSGATATATLTVKAASLAAGANTIVASYAGNGAFAASTGSTTVTLTAAASNVILTAVKTTNAQPGFAVKVQLQETGGAPTLLTGFTVNGVNFTPEIAAFLGNAQLGADATLTSVMNIQWSPLPATLVFVFNGQDPHGRQWTQTVSLPTK